MADDKQLSADQKLQQAVGLLAQQLEARGVLHAPAREIAERNRERLFVSDTGTVRVSMRYGGFYPAEADSPLRLLADELYLKAPQDVKADGFDLDDAKARLRRTGIY